MEEPAVQDGSRERIQFHITSAVYDAARARRQPGEAVSDAFPKLPLSRACGGQRAKRAKRKPSLLYAVLERLSRATPLSCSDNCPFDPS